MSLRGQRYERAFVFALLLWRFHRLRRAAVLFPLLMANPAFGQTRVAAAPVVAEREVVWRPEWSRFRAWQYATTATALGGSAYLALETGFREGGGAGVLFDDAVRKVARLRTRAGRDDAKVLGDVLFRSMIVYPLLMEPTSALVFHGSSDVMAQMFLINLQSYSWTALVTLTSEHFIGRARPSTAPCEDDPEYEAYCNGRDEYASFPSGHFSAAATGAGLVCVHHQHLPLYGGGWGDSTACAVAIAAAATAGAARLLNDRHWATDTLAGGAIGAVSGYLVPLWLHYGFGGSRREASRSARISTPWALMPWATPVSLGVSIAGMQ